MNVTDEYGCFWSIFLDNLFFVFVCLLILLIRIYLFGDDFRELNFFGCEFEEGLVLGSLCYGISGFEKRR